MRALTRAVSDLAGKVEDKRLCMFEASVARGRFSGTSESVFVSAIVLLRWFHGLSMNR